MVRPFSARPQRGGKQCVPINWLDELETCLTHLEECDPNGRTFFDRHGLKAETGTVGLRRGRGIADDDTDMMNAEERHLRKGLLAHGVNLRWTVRVAFRPVS